MNTDAPSLSLAEAKARVLGIQTKLHRWATGNASRRLDDLFNLVTDPAFLLVAWERVRTNRGARTAGVDGATAYYIREIRGEDEFLAQLRSDLRAGEFVALPVRERMIPKSGGKLRRLGIPTVRDRVVQATLKLVLEPIFEADCAPRGADSPGGVEGPAGSPVAAGGREAEGSLSPEVRARVGAALTT